MKYPSLEEFARTRGIRTNPGDRHEEMIGAYEIIVYSDGTQWHYVVVHTETGWSTSGSESTRGKALGKAREAVHVRLNASPNPPPGLTAKGKRMYESIKEAGSAVAPAAVVYARAKEGTPGLVTKGWAREHGYPVSNPKPLDLSRGVKKYLEFHDLDVKDIGSFSAKLSIPPEGRLLGIGKWVTYRSDKWERPKKHDYIHDFGIGVRCITFRGSTGSSVRVPVSYQRVETLVLLGTCLGFAFLNKDEEEIEAKTRGRKPELYCTPSGRALFVVQDKKQILAGMWGGKLGVESRGIVG